MSRNRENSNISLEVLDDEKSHDSDKKIAEAQEKFRQMMTGGANAEQHPLIERNPVYCDSQPYSLTITPNPDSRPSSGIYSRVRIAPEVKARHHVHGDIVMQRPVGDNTIIDSDDGHRVHNNWTTANSNTVNKWKSEIKESSFIYEAVKDKNTAVLQKILIWMLVFNTLTTVVTAIQGAILSTDPENPKAVWVGFSLSLFLFIVGGITTILSGAVSIYKWDKVVNELTTHISKLDGFYAIISHEMNLSDRLRKDANEFITKNAEAYLHITQNCPDISNSDYLNAIETYKKVTQAIHPKTNNACTTSAYKSSQKYIF